MVILAAETASSMPQIPDETASDSPNGQERCARCSMKGTPTRSIPWCACGAAARCASSRSSPRGTRLRRSWRTGGRGVRRDEAPGRRPHATPAPHPSLPLPEARSSTWAHPRPIHRARVACPVPSTRAVLRGALARRRAGTARGSPGRGPSSPGPRPSGLVVVAADASYPQGTAIQIPCLCLLSELLANYQLVPN